MFGGMSMPSLADIAAVTGNRNGGGLGDGNGWWVLIILFALFGGWGRGYGNGNDGGSSGSSNGALTRSDLCMDMNFQELQNGVRGISDAVNVGLANLNNAFCQQSYEYQSLVNNLNVTYLQGINTLQSLINQCCCDLRQLFAQAEYNRATDTCNITRAIQDAARDIIQNDNCNYRQLHDEQIALQMQQKDTQITALQGALSKCDTQNIVNAAVASAVAQIRPTADPAYIVPNPYANYNYGWSFNPNWSGCNNCNGGNNF